MSTNRRIYLDFNATAPLVAEARLAMSAAMAEVGNPSSVHAEGRRARDRVEHARNQVARLVGRPREEIVFTSGGTEANALGVLALAIAAERRGLPRLAVTTRLEHPSLWGTVWTLRARGWEIQTLEVSVDGEAIVAGNGDAVGLVALGVANHELGTRQVIERVTAWAPHALVHGDAVQAVGKLALPDADAIAISAHKLGGPQGVGALVLRVDDPSEAERVAGRELVAGHQERGRRPGTENLVGIVGFGAAAAALDPAAWPAVAALGDRLEAGLRALDGVRIHGAGAARVGGTINAGFAGARGESIVMALDLAGIAVSTGAACTSGSVQPSPVLRAIGQPPEQALEAVRFSLGRTTTADEIDEVLRVLPAILARARQFRS